MAGIFPRSGVAPGAAANATDADTNCADELFYATGRCPQRMDPEAMNALMSEILNAVNCGGQVQYDCTRLDNLCLAMQSNQATVAAATAAGTDSYGRAYGVGAPIITFADGQTLSV